MRVGEGFPYNPIDKSRRRHIVRACGGGKLTHAGIDTFLQNVGRPALGQRESVDRLFLGLLNERAGAALKGFDINAARAFSFGVLFFAGVTAELNQLDHIPVDDRVLTDILARDPRTFAMDCANRIDSTGSTGFRELAFDAGAILLGKPYTIVPSRASFMGAGAVDFVVKESLMLDVTSAELDAVHAREGRGSAERKTG